MIEIGHMVFDFTINSILCLCPLSSPAVPFAFFFSDFQVYLASMGGCGVLRGGTCYDLW